VNPTREVYWNVSGTELIYVLLAPALAIFAYGIYRHVRRWLIGRPAERPAFSLQRLKGLLLYGLAHRRIFNNRYAGLFHALFFSGFIVLFIGTVVVWLHAELGWRIMEGRFYLYFQSLALDVFGLLALIGLSMAFCRRYFFKPARLANTWRDAISVPLLVVILATGFALEGLRIAATGDPWAAWSPVGLATGKMLAAVLPADALRPVHASLWWFHLTCVFSLIAWVPYSKLLHLFTAPTNIYFRSLDAKGAMIKPIDLETAESFGVERIDQFTWKDLLDLDACTECGRCQDACPAFATDKPLSPKSLILDLRDELHSQGTAAEDEASAPIGGRSQESPMIGGRILEETLWSCTTCRACMEVCPVFIDHVPKIIDMRRSLVMEQGTLPEPMQQAMRSLEAHGHPYPGTTASRLDWCKDLDVKILSEAGPTEYLYWVGCSTSLNTRNQKTARALVQLLADAGVDFGILGNEEHCTGDAARRMGNEYLFQTLARRNIDLLAQRGVKKIITTCPHCFNTFKHEYPQFGADYEVHHHSQFLARLIEEGRLTPPKGMAETITFHDPCYLGRHNETYDEPRSVIAAVPGAEMVEMDRSRETSFCCGAGGGMMWAEDPSGKRASNLRAREALETGSDTLGVGCPFCMIMMEEGIDAEKGDQEMKVRDIAELLRGPEIA
jgi:Fe-S oxidoreductase/nitrate reductase gamma subunit